MDIFGYKMDYPKDKAKWHSKFLSWNFKILRDFLFFDILVDDIDVLLNYMNW